jgi:hypothetical protein
MPCHIQLNYDTCHALFMTFKNHTWIFHVILLYQLIFPPQHFILFFYDKYIG